MDPREFHRLAQRLASQGSAAECRTAVSRAYYATFNVGAEILRGLGFRIGKGAAAHGEVYHCLSNCSDPQVEDAASEINDLHGLRNQADYQLEATTVERPAIVVTIVQTAGEVIRTLDAAFTGPRRPQLQAAIAQWRKENGYP